MEFPARNDRHATQQKKKKQRGKLVDFKDLHARNDARHDYRINMIHITKKWEGLDGLPIQWAIKMISSRLSFE